MVKKLLFFITGLTLILSFFSANTYGFLGEDLGLDLYKNIDEGFEELEIKQYEYEMSGQGQQGGGRVMEHVNGILKSNGIECKIESIQDIELIASASDQQISEVYKRCKPEGADNSKETNSGGLSPLYIASVINEVGKVRTSLENRAEEKSKQIYDIAKIGIYSDGISENSPFDLITDLEEIDRVIFSEELEYIGEDYGTLDFGNELDDYLAGNDRIQNEPYNRNQSEDSLENQSDSEATPDTQGSANGEEDDSIREIIQTVDENGNPIITTHDGHLFACYQDKDESGLDETTLNWLDANIYASGRDIENQVARSLRAPGSLGDIDNRTRGRAGTPIKSRDLESKARFGPDGLHNKVYDTFGCESFFCITISFVTKQQNLFGAGGGGQTVSIESVLDRLSGHLDHISKTSLVQGKMTTNNFENNLVIKDLGEMLRGFGIQIQSKPVPILNIDNGESEKENNLTGDIYTSSNLIREYYKNLTLDYKRANDLDIFDGKIQELQAIVNSGEMPTTNSIERLEVYEDFKESLEKENKIISQAIDAKMIQEDLKDFYYQFIELERFTLSIDDFAISMAGSIEKMNEIPTQKP